MESGFGFGSNADPDPAIFSSDLQDVKKYFFTFFCLLLFECPVTSIFKDKNL
jgi:hypothetical protein